MYIQGLLGFAYGPAAHNVQANGVSIDEATSTFRIEMAFTDEHVFCGICFSQFDGQPIFNPSGVVGRTCAAKGIAVADHEQLINKRIVAARAVNNQAGKISNWYGVGGDFSSDPLMVDVNLKTFNFKFFKVVNVITN